MSTTYRAIKVPENRPNLTKGKTYHPTAEFNGNVMLLDDTGREIVIFREELRDLFSVIVIEE